MIRHPSPNHGPRRAGARPDMVILHYTAMDSAAAARDRLCDPAAEVSAHYLIGRQGGLWQLVPEDRRAWHAGAGQWGACGDVNSRSIGIEIDNDGQSPFAAAAMARLETLLAGILARWAIPPARVLGHADVAPGRKADPGPRFDWARLGRLGLALGPQDAPPEVLRPAPTSADPADLDRLLRRAGYTGPEPLDQRLGALRLRLRPGVRGGPADGTDLALLGWLAQSHPAETGDGA